MSLPHSLDRLKVAKLHKAGIHVEGWLGSGATSTVYAASRLPADPAQPLLALKLLHAEHAGHFELVLRLLNEERAAACATHPGLIRIYSSGAVEGQPYLLMERCYQTLAQRTPALSVPDRIEVVTQVAKAAAALHQAGVVHRDLKPSNIMFLPGPGLLAKIVDLGLAKLKTGGAALPVSTAATDVLGTADYRAPELWISAKDADGSADVYALGVILYELLTGELPFLARRESELMNLHLFEAPCLQQKIPGPLAALLQRMLAKSRLQRPDMRQVAERLDCYLRSAPHR